MDSTGCKQPRFCRHLTANKGAAGSRRIRTVQPPNLDSPKPRGPGRACFLVSTPEDGPRGSQPRQALPVDKARAIQDAGVSAEVQALPPASAFLPGAEAGRLTGPTQGAPSGFGGGYASRSSLSLRSSTEPLCSSFAALHCVGRGPGTQGAG